MVQPLWKTVLQVLKQFNRVTVGPRNSIPRYIPKINENTCLHKNLYTNVHRSIIDNGQKVETTQMSTNDK